MMKGKTCEKCGVSWSNQLTFCGACGAKLPDEKAEAIAQLAEAIRAAQRQLAELTGKPVKMEKRPYHRRKARLSTEDKVGILKDFFKTHDKATRKTLKRIIPSSSNGAVMRELTRELVKQGVVTEIRLGKRKITYYRKGSEPASQAEMPKHKEPFHRRKSKYNRFLSERIKYHMKFNKLNYMDASNAAKAEYRTREESIPSYDLVPDDQKKNFQELLMYTVNHGTPIMLRDLDMMGIKIDNNAEWVDFTIKFLKQSGEISKVLGIENKWRVTSSGIRYG